MENWREYSFEEMQCIFRETMQYELQGVDWDGNVDIGFDEAGEVWDHFIRRVQSMAWLDGFEAARLSDRINPVNPYTEDGEIW